MSLIAWLLGPVLAAISQLSEDVHMNQTELLDALTGISTNFGDGLAQLDKGIAEVIAALNKQGQTTPEVDAAVANLSAVAQALRASTQKLDDLNPDTPA
jgi:ABC-type transporter Mla subunit MlaD